MYGQANTRTHMTLDVPHTYVTVDMQIGSPPAWW
jgi:hypothetical protein